MLITIMISHYYYYHQAYAFLVTGWRLAFLLESVTERSPVGDPNKNGLGMLVPLVSLPFGSDPCTRIASDAERRARARVGYAIVARRASSGRPLLIPVSVKKTLLLCEPLPCKPAEETALQPLIWCFER